MDDAQLQHTNAAGAEDTKEWYATSGQLVQLPHNPWPDISNSAKWSVSSFKFGFGVECLRDENPDTYWHSDGPQPHFVTIEFPRKTAIQIIGIHLCFAKDDSYTPAALAIRAGTGMSDLQDIRAMNFEKPKGWINFDISAEPLEDGEGFKPIYAYTVQIIVAANHMAGKDTHIRGLRIHGPIDEEISGDDPFPFTSLEFKMYEGIR